MNRRRSLCVAAGVLLILTVSGCDRGKSCCAPNVSFEFPTIKFPSTTLTTAPPLPETLPPGGGPVTIPTGTPPTTPPSTPAQVDPVLPGLPTVSIPVVAVGTTTTAPIAVVTAPPLPPPTCDQLLAAITPLIPPVSKGSGQDDYEDPPGHPVHHCYGLAFGRGGVAYEFYSFDQGHLPSNLATATDPSFDPVGYQPVPDLGDDVSSDAPQIDTIGRHASRNVYFSCGASTCWMHLLMTFSGAPDMPALDGVFRGTIAALRAALGPVPVATTPTTTTAPRDLLPTCDQVDGLITSVIEAFGVSPVLENVTEIPTNLEHDYVGCGGGAQVTYPSPLAPGSSLVAWRTISFLVYVIQPGGAPDSLHLLPTPSPAPELGGGVTSDGGSFHVAEPGSAQFDTAHRVVRFPCGRLDCYADVAESAFAPADTDIAPLDDHLRVFIGAMSSAVTQLNP